MKIAILYLLVAAISTLALVKSASIPLYLKVSEIVKHAEYSEQGAETKLLDSLEQLQRDLYSSPMRILDPQRRVSNHISPTRMSNIQLTRKEAINSINFSRRKRPRKGIPQRAF